MTLRKEIQWNRNGSCRPCRSSGSKTQQLTSKSAQTRAVRRGRYSAYLIGTARNIGRAHAMRHAARLKLEYDRRLFLRSIGLKV